MEGGKAKGSGCEGEGEEENGKVIILEGRKGVKLKVGSGKET